MFSTAWTVLLFKIKMYLGKVQIWQVIVCLIIISLVLIIVSKYQNKSNWRLISLWSLNITAIITITFLGREFGMVQSSFDKLFFTYQYILDNGLGWAEYEALFNVCLMLPTGFLLAINKKVKSAMLLALCWSITIEVGQLVTGMGLFEIADIIDNFIGAVLGYYVCRLIQRFISLFLGDIRERDDNQ